MPWKDNEDVGMDPGPDEEDDGPDIIDEEDDLIDGVGFADPGGRSALRAATPDNPRDQPCPTCHAPNALTAKDVARHYQCDGCADALENDRDRGMMCGGPGKCELCGEADDE